MSERRIISLENTKVSRVPEAETLISDAMSIIQIELVKMHTMVKAGTRLDEKSGRLLNGYIKSLCELSRENRERNKGTDLSGMTTPELILMLAQSLKPDEMAALIAAMTPQNAQK